jgi:hypothetical protein
MCKLAVMGILVSEITVAAAHTTATAHGKLALGLGH